MASLTLGEKLSVSNIEEIKLSLESRATTYLEDKDRIQHKKRKYSYLKRNVEAKKKATKKSLAEQIFYRDFQLGIASTDTQRPDLNGSPIVCLDNIVIDNFENLDQSFPPQSMMVVLEQRSTSHMGNDAFREDFRKTLSLLKPGGVICSDGFCSSYSRILRFQEIMEVLAGNPEYKAEIVVDSYTREPLSLFVQRRHPSGFLTDQEKQIFLSNPLDKSKDATEAEKQLLPVYQFRPIKELAQRIDLRIKDSIRRQVKCACPDNDECFRGLHDDIELVMKNNFADTFFAPVHDKLGISHKEWERLYDLAKDGEIMFPEYFVQKIISEVINSDRVQEILKKTV